jgi:hypothetical protein
MTQSTPMPPNPMVEQPASEVPRTINGGELPLSKSGQQQAVQPQHSPKAPSGYENFR